MQIDDSVTIVTGAGSGIGRSLAEAFAAAGAPVVVGDINADGAEETRERIRASGGRAVALCADASSIAGIEELIGRAEDDFGPVDIFVANAGVIGPAGLGSEPDWDVTLDVNLRAHIRTGPAAGARLGSARRRPLRQRRLRGRTVAQIGAAAYAVTKHAAVGFAEWLAITHGDNGIGVTCVCPMGVDTPLLDAICSTDDPTTGRVVFMSSVSGLITTPGTGAYNASKYAIESLADALRMELRPWRIPVSLIEPGPIRTDMWGDVLTDYDAMTERLSHSIASCTQPIWPEVEN